MTDVTRILNAIEGGDERATDELLPVVYEELRLLAAQKLSHERPGQTLQATALVHEAYMRLVGSDGRGWDNRGHFFVAAAEAMRRILIDYARKKKSQKRGGGKRKIELDAIVLSNEGVTSVDDLISLDEALQEFSKLDKAASELVKLRFFAGLTGDQAAKALGVSHNTADGYWSYARAWLRLKVDGKA